MSFAYLLPGLPQGQRLSLAPIMSCADLIQKLKQTHAQRPEANDTLRRAELIVVTRRYRK
jgi:hypothetical protein